MKSITYKSALLAGMVLFFIFTGCSNSKNHLDAIAGGCRDAGYNGKFQVYDNFLIKQVLSLAGFKSAMYYEEKGLRVIFFEASSKENMAKAEANITSVAKQIMQQSGSKNVNLNTDQVVISDVLLMAYDGPKPDKMIEVFKNH